jgi:hypothetical protein
MPATSEGDALDLLSDQNRGGRPFAWRADALGLRETDLLLRVARSGRYVVLCPNTSSEGAKELVERLRFMLCDAKKVEFGTASFPTDAYGLEDLIDAAFLRGTQTAALAATNGTLEVVPHRSSRTSGRTPIRKRLFDLAFVLSTAPLWATLLG